MEDQRKLCRVCLGEGARYIFHSSLVDDEQCSVASINFIAEKLRFVLLLPINEQDGLAMWICELCLVQLNLAYRFKRMALESDQKLRHLGGASQQETCVEITNAITYHSHTPDSSLDIGPTVKQETEAPLHSDDHSDGMVLPQIASVESCSMEEFLVESKSDPPESRNDEAKKSSGMVTLNIDPTDPEEDKAFIQSIIKKPILLPVANQASPSTILLSDKKARDTAESSPLTVKSKGKKSKKSTRKRQENKPANHQQAPSPVDKKDLTALQSDGKVSKTPASNTSRKMESLKKSLLINMIDQRTRESPSIDIPNNIPIAEKVKLRRNSVCASSYYRSGW